jgi:hypothetical protein
MCEGVIELIVTCASLGVGGSVVIQVYKKKLFLVTKTVNTHMTVYFKSYWFYLPC